MTEADKNTKARHALEKTKMEAENKLERSSQDLQDLRERSALTGLIRLHLMYQLKLFKIEQD